MIDSATQGNKKHVEEEKQAHFRKQVKLAGKLRRRLTDTRLVITRKADAGGRVRGSVTAQDISDALAEAGFTIVKRNIILDRPFRSVGDFPITIRLHPDVACQVVVHVVSDEEAALRKEAARVFGDEAAAEEWLNERTPSLGDRKPVEMVRGSKEERARVFAVLGRIEHGIF